MGRGSIGRGGPRTVTRTIRSQQQPARSSNTGISLQTFRAADDDKKLQMLQRIDSMKVSKDGNPNTFVQGFLDALGWSDRKPEVVDEDTMEQRRKRMKDKGYYFHSDRSSSVKDSMNISEQVRSGKFFVCNGYSGAGLYVTGDGHMRYSGEYEATESASYGPAQIKLVLKNTTNRIDRNDLDKLVSKFKRNYPKSYKMLSGARNGYGGRAETLYSVVAAHYGYNMIDYGTYHVILDRSIAMVTKQTKKVRSGYGDNNPKADTVWKYYGD